MSYRNKTYVVFDADTDMWAYAYMKGWVQNDHIEFNFYDAHELRPLTDQASDDTVFKRLRERLANTKQVIVLVGAKTKNLRKFVPWEIEIALKLGVPIVVVNLNGMREVDNDRCPTALRNALAVHVSFNAKIIQFALDNFPDEFSRIQASTSGPRQYNEDVYKRLGL